MILYLPANLYPIMTVSMMGEGDPHTILGGVVALIEAESYPSAVLVLVASIIVPLVKLGGLTFLLLSVQRRWQWRPRDRTLAYRIIEAVGRWSMIDVFMVSILVALVNLGALGTEYGSMQRHIFALVEGTVEIVSALGRSAGRFRIAGW